MNATTKTRAATGALSAMAGLALCACGGGGGGSSAIIQPDTLPLVWNQGKWNERRWASITAPAQAVPPQSSRSQLDTDFAKETSR